MTNDEGMTKRVKSESLGMQPGLRDLRKFRGAHAPSRVDFGALDEIVLGPASTEGEKVRDHEGVIAGTRGA